MARTDLIAVTRWITAAAAEHGAALPDFVADRLGISRRSSRSLLSRLVAAQWLLREGSPRRALYRPGVLRQVVQRYPLDGLLEDLPWARDFAPYFELPHSVSRMMQHAFSELLNNAIDHSGGSQVTVSMRQTALQAQLLVSDDGCGVFDRIQRSFAIDDPSTAMLELSKGKLSSLPDGHRGHGLFFTSRLADVFDLHANQMSFQFRGWDRRTWYRGRPLPRQGTSAYVAIALDTPRTLNGVLRAHSADGNGFGFETTQVPLQLITGGATGIESRAQAKRVAARLQHFRRAEVDFSGIADIGHGFADELFRVFTRRNPDVEIVPLHMAPRVAEMVQAVRTAG